MITSQVTASQIPPQTGRHLNRALFLEIIESAQFIGLNRFTRQALLAWLATYPGDLPINLLYAQVLIKAGHPEQAIPILERLCRADPEYVEAAQTRLDAELCLRAEVDQQQKLIARQKDGTIGSSVGEALGCLLALGGEIQRGYSKQATAKSPSVPVWSGQIKYARQALLYKGNSRLKTILALDKAEQTLHQALAVQIPTPLAGVTHLQLLRLKGMPVQSLRTLASYYHQRWPDCLQFNLLLGEALLESNQAEQGVSWLHRAASRDTTGQVARRMWGEEHPYQSLWPNEFEFWLDVPIPAEVVTALGWNQLPEGVRELKKERQYILKQPAVPSKTEPELAFAWKSFDQPPTTTPSKITQRPTPPVPDLPETLQSVQAELDQVAARLNQPGLSRSDGRFPVYVVVTTRKGLQTQYGPQATAQLEIQLKRLVSTVGERKDWKAILFYADEGWGDEVPPAKYNDPWEIKLALADLDFTLGCNGEMIGSVLIIGGPDVVPFHHLPNPVDDSDHDVPSDNPYGTRDENYFIPEWSVGRLPGDASRDVKPLLEIVSMVADSHASVMVQPVSTPWVRRLWQKLIGWMLRKSGQGNSPRSRKPSFGYTAAAWRQASLKVFRPIGEARSLQASPPIDVTNGGESPLPSARLGYFNLHGLVDAVEWYGQSNLVASALDDGSSSVDYPVALRPQDVINSGHAPEVVFSEACYGAHILGRKVEEALALKFLQSGSVAVIGSTSAAYGSIDFPLTAADFLGHAFWNQLKEGFPAGEALRRAKIALAREMHNRQGYLDGEDQKTLISFVLYGDPLAQPLGKERQIKTILRPMKPVQSLRTVCDRVRNGDLTQPVSPEIEMQVKKVVKKYLPGMAGAQITISAEHINCGLEGHECPTAQLGQIRSLSNNQLGQPDRKVVVLSKQVKSAAYFHQHYARLTLDKDNRLVKLVVSR